MREWDRERDRGMLPLTASSDDGQCCLLLEATIGLCQNPAHSFICMSFSKWPSGLQCKCKHLDWGESMIIGSGHPRSSQSEIRDLELQDRGWK